MDAVTLRMTISQHFRDQVLMNAIMNSLKCGYISKKYKRNVINFIVNNFKDIYTKIIPFFKKYKIEGIKYFDFQDFCKAAELMKKKEHLTKEGLDKIRQIKSQMNKSRLLVHNYKGRFRSLVHGLNCKFSSY